MNTKHKDFSKKTQKDYSLAFKLQLINEIEKGLFTYKQSQKKHGIQGRTTVLVWLRKHGKLDWTSKTPMKKKAPPKTYISQLEAKIKRLEQEKEILNAAIDIADDVLKADIRKVFALVVQRYKSTGAKRATAQRAATLGYSRQYYYKLRKEEVIKSEDKRMIISMVESHRKLLHRVGTRKLHYLLKEQLSTSTLKCGGDKLFRYLGEERLLIQPRRRYIQTTDSRHWLRRYPNLIKEMAVQCPEQLWVSDITYIKTAEGNCYLNMVTDAFSKKIVGFSIADNMETSSMIQAYKMALKGKRHQHIQTIHHSDRGVQYCSKEYVDLSRENNCLISMTENGDPYENALAERMNRTIKEEFGLGEEIKTRKIAVKMVEEAVALYNNYSPHLALNYKTPNQIHEKIPDNKLCYQG